MAIGSLLRANIRSKERRAAYSMPKGQWVTVASFPYAAWNLGITPAIFSIDDWVAVTTLVKLSEHASPTVYIRARRTNTGDILSFMSGGISLVPYLFYGDWENGGSATGFYDTVSNLFSETWSNDTTTYQQDSNWVYGPRFAIATRSADYIGFAITIPAVKNADGNETIELQMLVTGA